MCPCIICPAVIDVSLGNRQERESIFQIRNTFAFEFLSCSTKCAGAAGDCAGCEGILSMVTCGIYDMISGCCASLPCSSSNGTDSCKAVLATIPCRMLCFPCTRKSVLIQTNNGDQSMGGTQV